MSDVFGLSDFAFFYKESIGYLLMDTGLKKNTFKNWDIRVYTIILQLFASHIENGHGFVLIN